MTPKNTFRIEKDALGEVKIPRNAYWGPQTQRAIYNFPISGLRFNPRFIRVLGLIKMMAAEANQELGLLAPESAKAIEQASLEILEGNWVEQFVVDVFQTGSGTSTHMNANEVIANRANEILGGKLGDKNPVHPNDHVNLGQSSNDVIPTCIHITTVLQLQEHLLPALNQLQTELYQKAQDFQDILKLGRTHLQDALPIRLGQEFQGYLQMIDSNIQRIKNTIPALLELTLGGTAVGTGSNTHPQFAQRVIAKISQQTGFAFRQTDNHFQAQGSLNAVVAISSSIKELAISLNKMANDIRWMASGPFGGIGEIWLPAVQPGSSMMPGKINPVICEALIQVCLQVIGQDSILGLGGSMGNFELNTCMPLMTYNLSFSIEILGNAIRVFSEKCLCGIKANPERCRQLLETSLSIATFLTPQLGYDKTAAVVQLALNSGKSIKQIILEQKLMTEDQFNQVLSEWIPPIQNRCG